VILIKMKLSVAFFLLGAASQTSGFAFRPMSPRSSTSLSAKHKIFIDGEAGTTGLQVRSRLEARDDLEIISPPYELRKDEATRKEFINQADCVILCKSLCSRSYLLGVVSP
jgi:N-acetyl-gamma-glutamyl-phosphate reductase